MSVTSDTEVKTADRGPIDRWFKISERGSTAGTEIRGGIVTFATVAYILVLNPLILGFVPDSQGNYLGGGTGDGSNLPAIAIATALVAGLMSIFMGAYANFPLVLAAGLGLNAFVANTIARQTTWADAMGLVVVEGIVVLILVLTGLRKAVFHAVPPGIKVAISVGIGLFIAFIGLVDAGIVRRVPDSFETTVPVQLGFGGQLIGWPAGVFAVGLMLVFILWVMKVRGAILISIIVTTILAIVIEHIFKIGPMFGAEFNPKGWGLTTPALPETLIELPSFSTFWQFNLFGAFEKLGILAAILLVFSLVLSDFFDTMGTMTGIGAESGLNDANGTPPSAQRILVVDSLAAIAGGVAGTSSNTSYIESASGVGEGARTGLSSIVTGVLFLLSIFFAPLVKMIPSEAAVPALLLVGYLMVLQIPNINWRSPEIAVPAFFTIIMMPFTYSITTGIGAGFIAYVVVMTATRKAHRIHPLMWVVSALFLVYFFINPITALLT